MPQRIMHTASKPAQDNLYQRWSGQITTSLQTIYAQVQAQTPLVPYTTSSKQSATTTVIDNEGKSDPYETTGNMHSEMVALQAMFNSKQWVIYGNVVTTPNGPVSPGNFTTNLPHCGFCTISLQVLGLPLCKPTCGNYNYAGNFSYPIPSQMKLDPRVISSYISIASRGNNQLPLFKQVLNCFFNNAALDWVLQFNPNLIYDDAGIVPAGGVGNRLIIDWANDIVGYTSYDICQMIWTQIWSCLYEINTRCGSS